MLKLNGHKLAPENVRRLLDEHCVTVRAVVPVGLISYNMPGLMLETALSGLRIEQIAESLRLPLVRLQAELEATQSLTDAVALLLMERLDAGRVGFGSMVIGYTVPGEGGAMVNRVLVCASALVGAVVMLSDAGAYDKAAEVGYA